MNLIVNWVNIMMYDVMPSYLGAGAGFTLDTYEKVFDTFKPHIDKDKIVMGFEPGTQAAGG